MNVSEVEKWDRPTAPAPYLPAFQDVYETCFDAKQYDEDINVIVVDSVQRMVERHPLVVETGRAPFWSGDAHSKWVWGVVHHGKVVAIFLAWEHAEKYLSENGIRLNAVIRKGEVVRLADIAHLPLRKQTEVLTGATGWTLAMNPPHPWELCEENWRDILGDAISEKAERNLIEKAGRPDKDAIISASVLGGAILDIPVKDPRK